MNTEVLKQPGNFACLDAKDSSLEKSAFAMLPACFEGTVSYGKGASGGPAAILNASRFLELYDEEFQNEPFRKGICTLAPMEFADSTSPEKVCREVQAAVSALLQKGKFPLILGGEHSISAGTVRAFSEKFGDNLSVLHFDAHADLRDEYEFSRFSHACSLRRMRDSCKSTVSVGVRSLSREEADLIKREKIPVFFKKDLDAAGITAVSKKIVPLLKKNVFVSIDLDAFDPAEMPSVGTPEPNGLHFAEAVRILSEVAKKKRVVGADLMELAPIAGLEAPNFFAARLAHKLLAMVAAGASKTH
ncbi:MAG: agmatinase [Candidatus Micrarchaeia archaeon]|jgi:agmatinase